MGDKSHLIIRTYSKNVLVNVFTIALVTHDLILQEVDDGDQDDGDQHQDEGEPGLDPEQSLVGRMWVTQWLTLSAVLDTTTSQPSPRVE